MSIQLDTLNAIRKALDNDALLVHYQPIINLKIPAMAGYSLQLHAEGPNGRLLSERDLHRTSIDASLQYEIDRWAVSRTLKDLMKLRQSSALARLNVNVSAAAIAERDFPDWIARQLKLNEMVGAGLVLCVRTVDLTSNLQIVYRNFRRLQKLNVETCITQFPDKPQAFELLKFLRAEYINISTRLLKADKITVNTIVENARKYKAKILLTDIDDAEGVNLQWATGTDYLQGKYIQGFMDDMSFDFDQV